MMYFQRFDRLDSVQIPREDRAAWEDLLDRAGGGLSTPQSWASVSEDRIQGGIHGCCPPGSAADEDRSHYAHYKHRQELAFH